MNDVELKISDFQIYPSNTMAQQQRRRKYLWKMELLQGRQLNEPIVDKVTYETVFHG
jgi:hypothetical protein